MIIFVIIVVFILVFGGGYYLDGKADYSNMKYRIHNSVTQIGGGEEYYVRYWIFQPKKKVAAEHLITGLGCRAAYREHAKKTNVNAKSKIPFLEEIYGVVR